MSEVKEKEWRGCEDLARYQGDGFTIVLRRVACGKDNCTKCPHGPYWYYVYAVRGNAKTVYVGRTWKNGGCARATDLRGRIVSFCEGRGLMENAKEQAGLLSAGTKSFGAAPEASHGCPVS